MNNTGIIRRIDDLGRVIIPKEIRRFMHLQEGDPLEILTDGDKVIFAPYHEFNSSLPFIQNVCKSLKYTCGVNAIITDLYSVSASSDRRIKETDPLNGEFKEFIQENLREITTTKHLQVTQCPIMSYAIAPILRGGDLLGSIVLLQPDECKEVSESALTDIYLASRIIGNFLSE